MIAAAEGAGRTPAYRGQAYAVFEDLALDSFGRRVPSITFEVFADEDAVSLAEMVTGLAGGGVSANCPTRFSGYAASGDSVRGAVETLTAVVPVRVQDDGLALSVIEQVGSAQALDRAALGATTGGAKAQRLTTARQSASTITQTLVLAYYDSGRDYQQGMQRARRDGGVRKEDRLDLPVTLDATTAKALVEARLNTIWAERVTAKVQLPWRYLALRPGDDVVVPGSADTWRISAIKFNRMVLACDLVRTTAAFAVPSGADAGRSVAQLDAPAGPTTLVPLDLPQLSDGAATQPIVMAAAAGAAVGWRAATLSQSLDDGASWAVAGPTALPAIIGHTVTVLGAGSSTLIDLVNTVDVDLLNTDMQLADATDALLLSGRNVAMLGSELVQFGRAMPLGGARWRLSRLWRGRRGTEEAMSRHAVGESFTLLTAPTLAALTVPSGTTKLRVSAQGVGDGAILPEADAINPGFALRPLSPTHLTATLQSNGDTQVTWVRRSRDGWRWVDGVDAPLAEETEAYVVTVTPSTHVPRTTQTDAPRWTYTAATRAADLAAGATGVTISVAQIGTAQTSRTTSLTLIYT